MHELGLHFPISRNGRNSCLETVIYMHCTARVHKSQLSGHQGNEFYSTVPNIFSIIIAFLHLCDMQNVYQFTCSRQKVPHNMRITGQSRIVDPQYVICFMSPNWNLEFGGGS